jgi:hypothetical protein
MSNPSLPPHLHTNSPLTHSDSKEPFSSPSPSDQRAFPYVLSLLQQPLFLLALDPAVLSVVQSPKDPYLYIVTDTIGFKPLIYTFDWSVRFTPLPDGCLLEGGPAPGVLSSRFRYTVGEFTAETRMGDEPKRFCRAGVKVSCVPTWMGCVWMGSVPWQVEVQKELLSRLTAKIDQLRPPLRDVGEVNRIHYSVVAFTGKFRPELSCSPPCLFPLASLFKKASRSETDRFQDDQLSMQQ